MSKSEQYSRRIRIALVVDRIVGWTAGGTERQLVWLCRCLDQALFDPVLFVFEGTSGLDTRQLPFEIRVLNSRARWFNVRLLWDLRKRFSEFVPQIVQTFFYDGTLFGVIAARLAGVQVIVQSRRSVGYARLGFLRRVALHLANWLTTCWQCNSRFVATSISRTEGIPADKIAIFPNIVDTEEFCPPSPREREVARRELGLPVNAPIFISVANLRPVKDLVTLVRAAAQVHQTLPEAQFVIVGEGPLINILNEEIDRLELNEVIRLVGPQRNIRTWLTTADIGILTSQSEGSSNALMEYMVMGLPTIVSDIPANRELVDGLFFRTGDPHDLAAKILSLWMDTDARNRIRVTNAHKIKQHEPRIIMARLQEYYLKLTATDGCA